jgi:subtilase family serine protease
MQITGFKGFLSSRYSPLADEWRDHKVFSTNLNDIQSVKVEFNQEPEKSYVITRVGKHAYKLENLQGQTFNQNIDTLRMLNFLSSFADIRFEALLNSLPETRKDSVTNSPFLHQITLTNTQGEQNVVTTFTKKKFGQFIVNEDRLAPLDLDRMYARVNQGKDFVLIQYFVFDKVLRPVNYFIPGSPDYDSF